MSAIRRRGVWRVLAANPIGVTVFVLALFGAVAAPALAPFDPTELVSAPLDGVSGEHWLGTDQLGRDVLSRVLYGLRPALLVALVTPALAGSIGVAIGVVSGYARGLVDAMLMRTLDGLNSVPGMVIVLVIIAGLGPGLFSVVIALAAARVAVFARIARTQTTSVVTAEYVEAARLAGAGHPTIVVTHVLPNIASPLVVEFFVAASTALTTEAALSFLGLGLPPPAPTWGGMLREGLLQLQYAPLPPVAASLAIFLAVFGLNALEDTARRVLP